MNGTGKSRRELTASPDTPLDLPTSALEPLLTPEDVAMVLRLSRRSVYVLVDEGRLGCVRVGRRLRFSRKDLDELLRRDEDTYG